VSRGRLHRVWRGSPLRTRLSLALVSLVALVLLVVGALTEQFLRQFLVESLDSELGQVASQVASRPFGQLAGVGVGTVAVQMTPDGRLAQPPVLVVARPDAGETASLTTDDVHALSLLGPAPTDVNLSSLGDYRFLRQSTPRGDVIVGLPLRSISRTVDRLLIVETVAFASALLVLGGVGVWLIRRELAPLERVAATAQQVTALPLTSGEVVFPDRVPTFEESTEITQVSTAFNAMLGHVESALTARAATEEQLRQFIADASHELRTPLAVIRGYAELSRRAGTAHPDDLARAMTRIEAETSGSAGSWTTCSSSPGSTAGGRPGATPSTLPSSSSTPWRMPASPAPTGRGNSGRQVNRSSSLVTKVNSGRF
jgi:two-component system OmpR family sensor kinase